LTQRLSAYSLNRDVPSSAPVTPPTSQTFFDPRSRASTLTESSPPLQASQKDARVPQHYLTPPSEGQSTPTNIALSQSLPVSRRNSSTTDTVRVGQDLSVIYENAPVKYFFNLMYLTLVLCINRIIGSRLGRCLGHGQMHLLKQLMSHLLMVTKRQLSNVAIVFHQSTCLEC
jgi:hypothetical protein